MTGNGAGHGGQARNYSWEPFAAGHTMSMVHGADSPRTVDPLSALIVAELLKDSDCPEHLHRPRWSRALAAWGRAEAQCALLTSWLADKDIEAALSETNESVETTTQSKARSTKVTSGRRVEAALSALDRAERRAAGLRNDLGLTPASAARMRLDLADKYDSALQVKALIEHDQEEKPGVQ